MKTKICEASLFHKITNLVFYGSKSDSTAFQIIQQSRSVLNKFMNTCFLKDKDLKQAQTKPVNDIQFICFERPQTSYQHPQTKPKKVSVLSEQNVDAIQGFNWVDRNQKMLREIDYLTLVLDSLEWVCKILATLRDYYFKKNAQKHSIKAFAEIYIKPVSYSIFDIEYKEVFMNLINTMETKFNQLIEVIESKPLTYKVRPSTSASASTEISILKEDAQSADDLDVEVKWKII